jgi:uncharacterized caspase-like protein
MAFLRCRAVLLLLVLATIAATGASGPLLAAGDSKRLALVLGNSAYENVATLVNPANDAADIAQKLKSLDFEVMMATDVGHAKMVSMLQAFKERLTREHVALFFFAGHGVTVNNESFLIPVDSPAQIDLDEKGEPRPEMVTRHLVRMSSVLEPLEASKIGLLFLDACRTNAAQPELSLRFVSLKTNRAVQVLRGTASMEIKPSPYSAGVFRAYATQLDNVASDGAGRNSPFTKALLKHIGTKGISIQELMIRVRKDVKQETANKQIPWEEAALNESFYFVPQAVTGSPSPTSAPGKGQAGKGGGGVRNAAPARSSSGRAGGSNLPPNVGVGIGTGM